MRTTRASAGMHDAGRKDFQYINKVMETELFYLFISRL